MDLWIKTQKENKLLKVNYIEISKTTIYSINSLYNESVELGTYSNEERTKEVLNEIENLIKLTYTNNIVSTIPIYHMPKE